MKPAWSMILVALMVACGGERPSGEAAKKSPPAAMAEPMSVAAFDLQFIDAMRKHHAMAIPMAQMAVERSSDSKLREMGSKMAADQSKEIAQLGSWRKEWFGNAPDADVSQLRGTASMEMDMTHVQSLSGAPFDRMFVDMMIPHHEGAVLMSCDALERSTREELRSFARDVIRKQEREISDLSAWKAK
ncbi:MAG TPA: DUF305 domain-containing protein [Thermoanaerobaculia bacterium]